MLFVDSADPQVLEGTLPHPAINGFTTNPTLVARAHGGQPMSLEVYLQRVDGLIDLAIGFGEPARRPGRGQALRLSKRLHVMVQVAGPANSWGGQVERLAARTEAWRGKGGNKLTIKLPPSAEGLGLCRLVGRLGLGSLVTAVFNPVQAAACCEAGADGAIVYLRRMQDEDAQWRPHVEAIRQVLKERDAALLMASIPTAAHLADALAFSQDVTVAPAVVDGLLDDPQSAKAMAAFDACLGAAEVPAPGYTGS